MALTKWLLAVAVAAVAMAAGLHSLQLGDAARLSASQASVAAAARAERVRDLSGALELYEAAIRERGAFRLPWADWDIVTQAHARAASALQRLDDGSGSPHQQREQAEAMRNHARAVIAEQPDHPLANGVLADSLARYGEYPAALPFLARIDRLAGRGAPYLDAMGKPSFPLPTVTSSVLPTSASAAAELEAELGPADWGALVNFDSWLRRHGTPHRPHCLVLVQLARSPCCHFCLSQLTPCVALLCV
eukprot:COSAG05_NODE_800_length_7226_cov_4.300126_5_plen_248_part_00